MNESQTPHTPPTEGIIRKNLLSETAAAHIKALEDLQFENRELHNQVENLIAQRQKAEAKLEFTTETLLHVRKQLDYYQNFAVTLATKVNDAQAVMASAMDLAREAGNLGNRFQPLSAEDEERLKHLAGALAPEKM